MSKEELAEGDLVEIRFVDLETQDEWTKFKDAKLHQVPQCKVPGYFLNEDDVTIRLARLVANDGECDYIVIPKGIIKSIRKVETGELDDFEERKE